MGVMVLKGRMRELSGEWYVKQKVKKLSEVKGCMIDGFASAYLEHDSAAVARIRARFRFDSIKSNRTLHRINKLITTSPNCTSCSRGGEETRDQILRTGHAYLNGS